MTQRYIFFNSALGDLRTYQASDFAEYFGSVLSTGLLHTDNVPGMSVSVETGTLNTIVSAGKAIMKGHFYDNTADLTLTHAIPEATLNRIDRIVLRLDLRNSERNILLKVLTGVASSTPEAPVLQRDNFIYEISLAQILIRANTVQLLQSDLVDERLDEDLAGLVYSLISIPTSQFQAEWDAFMAGIADSGFASGTDFATHKAEDTIDAHNASNISLTSTNLASTDVQDGMDELFTFANDGKIAVADAVTAKGVTASPTDTFSALATKIGQINTGKKFASGTVTASGVNDTFISSAGAQTFLPSITVTGLTFKPSFILVRQTNGDTQQIVYDNRLSLDFRISVVSNKQSTPSAISIKETSPATITTTGFVLPVISNSGNYTYMAIE